MKIIFTRSWIFLLSLLYFLGSNESKAQNSLGFEHTASCLKLTMRAYGNDTSCTSVAWFIDSSNNAIRQGNKVDYTFTTSGTHQVCMVVYNFCTRKDTTICKSITLTACDPCDSVKPEIEITAVKDTCGKFYFKAFPESSNSRPMKYLWSFGEGTKSEQQKTNFRYLSNDSYYVCAKFNYNAGGKTCERIVCKVIKVDCYSKPKCEWGNIQIGYGLNSTVCGKTVFEATAKTDTCIQIENYFNGVWRSGRVFDYTFSENGTYKYGFRYKNKCTGCDTTLYDSVSITCFPKKSCNWGSIQVGSSQNSTICGKVVFEATAKTDTCIVIENYFNGVIRTGRIFDYTFTANGTYKYAFRYKNKCTGCDTTLYDSVTITCFPKKVCNWNVNFEWMNYADSAKTNCRKYYFVRNNRQDTCLISKIKIVSGNSVIFDGPGSSHYYTFEQNGYYNVCYWFKNNCTTCDTWICKTVVVNCASANTYDLKNTFMNPSPNPTKHFVELNNNQGLELTIFDLLGKEKYREKVGVQAVIDLSKFEQGSYILRGQLTDGEIQYFRLIKE